MSSSSQPRSAPIASQWWLWGGTLVAALGFGAGNFAVNFPWFVDSWANLFWLMAWLGVVFAQIGLGAIWLALGRPAALARVAVASVGFLVLVVPMLAGCLWGESVGGSRPAAILLLVPFFTVVAAFPLWLLRIIFGWQISHEAAPPATISHQFSIGNLLVLTSLIAFLMAGCQRAQHFLGGGVLEFWLLLGVWTLIVLLISSLTLIPASFSLSRQVLGLGLLGGIAVGIGAALVALSLLAFGGYGQPSAQEFLVLVGFVAAPIFTLVLILAALMAYVRGCGYRLVMGQTRKAERPLIHAVSRVSDSGVGFQPAQSRN